MNSFNRRDFLRGASTLAGVFALPISLTQLAQAQLGGAKLAPNPTKAEQIVRGVVYLDQDGSGKRLPNSKGIPNVRVSNGRDIVVTDAQGRYELSVSDDSIIFLQKPSGFRTSLDENNQPRFYHIHKPAGSPANFKYAGIAPTGALPVSLDFGLQPQTEPDQFRAVLWGDPQPRNLEEVDFIARDIAQELIGVKAAFGLSLGDNAFNNLSTLEPLNDVTGQLGIPWYSVIGNHDLNFEAPDDELSAETFKRVYGPTYYSFDYGSTHFVVLDNVKWLGPDTDLKNANYTGGFGEKQLAWLKNDLAGVPRDRFVVLFMHIPIATAPDAPIPDVPGKPPRFIEADRRAFLALLQDCPNTLSISGHTHVQYHAYVGREEGWNGAEPHHHFNCGTTSGSWWSGAPDEQGIPNTTMRDGTPNGYAFLNVNGSSYTLDWQVARSKSDYQMTVYIPSEIEVARVATTPLQVNVFNGCPKTRVEYKVGNGAWATMQRVCDLDPGYANLKSIEEMVPAFDKTERKKKAKTPWRALPEIEPTPHLWRTPIPALPAGAHTVDIRVTDQWNRVFEERRLVRVV
ncbi:hypothetical protein IAD21_05692 [Abditibacteriota bacterium]|nr:hypothetical protein IAD21_05692 [Abditibacteriota bacterium]